MSTLEQVVLETKSALAELFEVSGLKAGDLLVVGCSSSEIIGGVIGHASSPETGMVVAETILNFCKERGVFLAAQCCEHLNRALIVEETAAEKFGYEEVCVIPQPKASGSFATAVYNAMEHPVAVEHVRAKAGLDIGGTMIGMHLKEVLACSVLSESLRPHGLCIACLCPWNFPGELATMRFEPTPPKRLEP